MTRSSRARHAANWRHHRRELLAEAQRPAPVVERERPMLATPEPLTEWTRPVRATKEEAHGA